MDAYQKIELLIAQKYNRETTPRTATGDFILSDNYAVNIKSNNVHKKNYSPNMISIKKMHKWVFEEYKMLSFIFVDYYEENSRIKILKETEPILIEHISWRCLTIEAQGYGVIQRCRPLDIDHRQTKRDFYAGFLRAYKTYRQKEEKKHQDFSKRFIQDLDTIDW